jgi:hypothetical protein
LLLVVDLLLGLLLVAVEPVVIELHFQVEQK